MVPAAAMVIVVGIGTGVAVGCAVGSSVSSIQTIGSAAAGVGDCTGAGASKRPSWASMRRNSPVRAYSSSPAIMERKPTQPSTTSAVSSSIAIEPRDILRLFFPAIALTCPSSFSTGEKNASRKPGMHFRRYD